MIPIHDKVWKRAYTSHLDVYDFSEIFEFHSTRIE